MSQTDTRQVKYYTYRDYSFSITENKRMDKFLSVIKDNRQNRDHSEHIMTGRNFAMTFKTLVDRAKKLIDLQY